MQIQHIFLLASSTSVVCPVAFSPIHPRNGATGVPLNAELGPHVEALTGPDGQVSLETILGNGGISIARASDGLEPNTTYTIESQWGESTFTTGDAPDYDPPEIPKNISATYYGSDALSGSENCPGIRDLKLDVTVVQDEALGVNDRIAYLDEGSPIQWSYLIPERNNSYYARFNVYLGDSVLEAALVDSAGNKSEVYYISIENMEEVGCTCSQMTEVTPTGIWLILVFILIRRDLTARFS